MKTMIILVMFTLLSSLAAADQVNMNISVNGTSNLNITIDADDTLAREMINQTNEDLGQLASDLANMHNDAYGTTTGSGPRDMLLDEIETGHGNPITTTEGMESISEVCSDPFLSSYLGSISSLPPLEFVKYLKGLGYDDEAHINFVWTMCQQQYIDENQERWSNDKGITMNEFVNTVGDAIEWLSYGKTTAMPWSIDLAKILSNYFASKSDVYTLVNKINEQDLRIQALERAMEKVAPAAYCQGKLDLMKEYNLTGVKCGTNSTMYWNAEKAGFDNYNVISYTDCTEDWRCSEWSSCYNGLQSRACSDANGCGSFEMMPGASREC